MVKMTRWILLFFICHCSTSAESDPVCAADSFCSQIELSSPSFYFERHVTTVGKLGSMICPPEDEEFKLKLFECDVNKCRCNKSLLLYNNCFLHEEDFHDKFVKCTDCKNFAEQCACELHKHDPKFLKCHIHSPRVSTTTSKPNPGLAVFITSSIFLIVATIGVYVYKHRRRQMRQL
ncbi:uncharacterized protein LOC134712352 [Mytilus trossulus]|uniref:uncharacterized protein LOC134712352 n=1 Tax=Mytilus trossulus TaxID=6551 RepID=UPI003003C1F4